MLSGPHFASPFVPADAGPSPESNYEGEIFLFAVRREDLQDAQRTLDGETESETEFEFTARWWPGPAPDEE